MHYAVPRLHHPASLAKERANSSDMLSKTSFHSSVVAWFQEQFGVPTPPQAEAWPLIKAGQNVLIAAPTGSGKTLAAFLSAIDDLVWQGEAGTLKDETQIVYVSPLKALSNDIRRNLEVPLVGIRQKLREQGRPDVEIRSWVRTGDTSASERQRMARQPPHIVVTTPESLYILLGSETGRRMLSTTRTSSIVSPFPASRWMCWRSKSWRKWQATSGERMSCSC